MFFSLRMSIATMFSNVCPMFLVILKPIMFGNDVSIAYTFRGAFICSLIFGEYLCTKNINIVISKNEVYFSMVSTLMFSVLARDLNVIGFETTVM